MLGCLEACKVPGSNRWQKLNDFIHSNMFSIERVVQNDAFDLGSRSRFGKYDPASARFLAPRQHEVTGSIVAIQKFSVLSNKPINLR